MSPPVRALAWSLCVPLLLAACGDAPDDSAGQPGDPTHAATVGILATAGPREVPGSMRGCLDCHERQVERFLGHGMSASMGPLDHVPRGELVEPHSGARYGFVVEDVDGAGDAGTAGDAAGSVASDGPGGPTDVLVNFDAVRRDGGLRSQRVVGRIGAGVHDVSYVGSERHTDGQPMGRLSFLPVEFISGHGAALSPFEQFVPGMGLDMPVTGACLRCHTTDDTSTAPGAARDQLATTSDASAEATVWPGAQLGNAAFTHLAPLGCSACHGAVAEHERLKRDSLERGAETPLGLQPLAELSAAAQRDVCARCHLQGDASLELAPAPRGGPQPVDAMARRAVLVPAEPDDDFRFVGQLERLVLSACFAGASDELTCTSCHLPHAAVAAQGTASFDRRCQSCHGADGCVRPDELAVRDVTGEPARSADGCVDCHVRRSQPFDLAELRTADHFVRRHIPRPAVVAAREQADVDGPLRVFHDGRLDAALATAAGRRWQDGLVAVGLFKQGRIEQAAEVFARWPEPGSAAARTPAPLPADSPAAVLPPLERSADVHHVRGLVLETLGDVPRARAAYSDALHADPTHPQARLNRAGLSLAMDDPVAAMADAAELLARYPLAEKPWNLRAQAAARAGEVPAATAALLESARLWPSDPAVWHELGRLFGLQGTLPEARRALLEVRRLTPTRTGLAADLAQIKD